MNKYIPLKGMVFFISILLSSCLTTSNNYDKVMPGIWRGELYLDESNPMSRNISKVGNEQDISLKNAFTEGVLPFNFEVSYKDDSMMIDLINGKERVRAEETFFGFNKKSGKDTVRINFVAFDTYLRAEIEDGVMTGAWYNPRKNWRIPFRGIAGKDYRFTLMKDTPKADISGKWQMAFKFDSRKDTMIGQFVQKGNYLTGTFASPTGDYGYLEGTVQGDKVLLSGFNGGWAYLVTGKVDNNNQMEGLFYSGLTGRATWTAIRKDNAQLPDAGINFRTSVGTLAQFAFEDENGKLVHLSDSQFEGKAKVIAITGTWCPNCKDEARFLTEYLKQHSHQDIAVIGLAFEAYKDTTKVRSLIKNYRKVLNLPYPILWAGMADKEAYKKVPFISKIDAYPTMIFLDKKNRVVKVHSGFSGPATDEYDSFKKEFESEIGKLLML